MLEGLPNTAKDTGAATYLPPAPAPADSKLTTSAGGEARQEIVTAREIRAMGLVSGLSTAQIADEIHDRCGPVAGTSWIRAYRLALGVSLADLVAQVRAWYASEGRPAPRFSETLLSAYESGQKRPGPEYLHYLCTVYRAEPPDLGYPGQCFCGRTHRAGPARPAAPQAPPGPAPVQRTALDTAVPGPASGGLPSARPAAPGPQPPMASRRAESLEGRTDPRAAEDDDDTVRRAQLRMIADIAARVDSQFLGAVERIRRTSPKSRSTSQISRIGGTVMYWLP